ncbi:xanthine dehydrogenase family protein subunit M [Thalassobaculum sp.]|uniref:FAD binding domain-containing protein n=1 Tax=Thalassobaculum sp. TaxID=2022740 RepID=UPI0032F021AD
MSDIALIESAGARREPPTRAGAQFIAGGTNLVDYMKLDVARPDTVIDLNSLDDSALRRINIQDTGIRLGALVRMSEVEDHNLIRQRYPVIAESLGLTATRQIRNMATLAGNLLQRTRCEYFRETSWGCNKREPGSGCAAIGGVDRQHAILGTSQKCIATYPGDFAQALVALDAMVEIEGKNGLRKIPVVELHQLPGDTPHIDTSLQPADVITAITVPAGPWAERSHFVKVRDRTSYAFALASAAVALELDGEKVRDVRIAIGGVATVPWRARLAEDTLRGQALDEQSAELAAEAAFSDAHPGRHNAFKLDLGKATIVQALMETKAMQV